MQAMKTREEMKSRSKWVRVTERVRQDRTFRQVAEGFAATLEEIKQAAILAAWNTALAVTITGLALMAIGG